jgi:hypothetical protein
MKMPSFLTGGDGSDEAGPFRTHDGRRAAIRRADLAVQYEELLDQVWRCEREWKLDDRIAYACRGRRG